MTVLWVKQVEYYRDILEQCGAVRAGAVNLDRFEDIPFLTRDIVPSRGSRIRADYRDQMSMAAQRRQLRTKRP